MTNFFESELFEPIDLCSCFEPIFDLPPEQEAVWNFSEPEPTLENTSFYATDPDGAEYFYCGGTRIKIRECFTSQGKEMEHLVEDAIQSAANLAGVTLSTVYSLLDPARQQVSITTIKKLCDGLDVTLGQFFACSLFDRLEQEMQ